MKKTLLGRISPFVLLLLLALCVFDRSGITALTLAAACVHESGHFLAARLLHIPLRGLRLDFIGARMELCGALPSYGSEWLLCAAGPFFSLLASAAAAPLWQIEAARIFSCASLVLGLLNLLPIRGFDGGRMLEVALLRIGGTALAQRLTPVCSFCCLFLLWAISVYFLLRAGDGLSLFCFSLALFLRFFDETQ